ncbi:MAG TPA: TRZ/ATZ family hydrolase [Gammaproteobacteria bacterium]|nr:TRZ/ATZ family hydrolase [Gammaproteobacteria bacterium]HLC41405.1 TRZ/ATZ family hydrolase [Methylomirabilota bacterium]
MIADTLLCARWIVPVEPADSILEHHTIVIREGNIQTLLPTEEALAQFSSCPDIQYLDDHVLIPGLINAHTHSAMTLFRGIADDLPLMVWLNEHIWPAEQRWVNPEFAADGTRLAIAEMIRSGTTCLSDMYFHPDITAEVVVETGVRVLLGLIVIDFPTPWAANPGEYFEKAIAVHDRFKHYPLIRTAFAPHAPYTVGDESLSRIATLAEELDIPIHMHLHETRNEIEQHLEQHGVRPLQRLERLGLLGPRLNAVHMTQIDRGEFAPLKAQGVHVVHCPESNLKLASGFCPVQELLDQGVNVALGTDGAASNNDLDMLGEMRTAALLGKGLAGDPQALSARQVLRMATINGAKALAIDDITGSLEPGKAADIVAINLDAPETRPVYDAISQVIYSASRNQVTDVWVAGRQLLKQRELLTIDIDRLMQKTSLWESRLTAERKKPV